MPVQNRPAFLRYIGIDYSGAAVPFISFLESASLLHTLVSIALLASVGFYISQRHKTRSAAAWGRCGSRARLSAASGDSGK